MELGLLKQTECMPPKGDTIEVLKRVREIFSLESQSLLSFGLREDFPSMHIQILLDPEDPKFVEYIFR